MVLRSRKRLPQTSHGYGFSPVWDGQMSSTSEDLPALSTSVGLFSGVNALVITSESEWRNLFPHFSHGYGFSPVWMRLCLVKSPD